MPALKRLLIIIAALVWFSTIHSNLNGQSFSFKNFLPDTYIYSLNQDINGFLWVGTGTGLEKFDGFDFRKIIYPDSVAERYVTISFRDRGGRLWFGCNDGALFYNSADGLVTVPTKGIQSINDIFEDKDGSIWVIPQDKMILKIDPQNPGNPTSFFTSKPIIMTSGRMLTGGDFLIGTQENLLLCRLDKDTLSIRQTIEGIEYTKVQAICKLKTKESWLIGTEGSGLFRVTLSDGKPVMERLKGHPELESLDIKSIMEDNSRNVWISAYGSGIFQIKFSDGDGSISSVLPFTTESGLLGSKGESNVRTIFQDMEGNIWIGYYGDGLSMLSSDAYYCYAPSDKPEENNIISICGKDNKFLLGTPKGYFMFDPGNGRRETFVNLSGEIGNEISYFHVDDENNIWMGTKGSGLYVKRKDGQVRLFRRSGNTGEDYIRHINSKGDQIWIGTLNGIVILNRHSGDTIRTLTIYNRLPHNSINQVFIKTNGNVLPATECDRLYDIDLTNEVIIGKMIMRGSSKNKVLCFDEDKKGGIWAGTAGNGLFHITNDTVTRITSSDGLLSNYCYSILSDKDGIIWIGHERGFSKYDPVSGIVKGMKTDFAKGKGGDCNPNSIREDNGRILIGTTEGLVVYDKEREKGKVHTAPVNNVISVTVNNKPFPVKSSYTLKYKMYTIRIDYVGISLSDPERVLYKTKIDNLNEEWSELKSSRSIEYPMGDGRYRFNMISFGEDGLSQKNPLTFEITIKKPYWRTWWFTLLILMTVGGIVAIIVREREKAQQKVKEYLETELAARTRLVLKQKDEIELQNIEITDSINYAKRIQSSILPDIARLKETFKDAFILFHPRDIVSGDFYWFDKINDEKFIIVCADSTGHGVPGAFMSMIGSTLLQDIISRKGITKPSQILTMLDKQIFSTLNQNVDVGVSNDGMDMVVCEVNVKSKLIRFASAMRPVIIVMGGESYYIKGNRCSVGGESVIEKYFDDQEYYLSEGDTVYMFSDGLPDQFGGADGKKMKIARMKKLIEEASVLPMSEQKQIISDFFFEWKGDYEQVDDILLMGIRL